MGWCTEYASRNSSICGQNFLLEIAVFRDGGSTLFVCNLHDESFELMIRQ
jgi:hypothetical protein